MHFKSTRRDLSITAVANHQMEQRGKSKRVYVDLDYDEDELGRLSNPHLLSVAKAPAQRDRDAAMMQSFVTVQNPGTDNTEIDSMCAPRVRRLRVGVEAMVSSSSSSSSASTAVSYSYFSMPHSSMPQFPMTNDAVVPGMDYGPCRLCGVPLGNAPFLPYQLMAKFCAASQAAGLGMLQQLEHNSIVQQVEDRDPHADVVYSIHLPRRVPYHCECSEKCYILYRTAADGALGIMGRVLALLGCKYDDSELTAEQKAGVARQRGVITAELGKICDAQELGFPRNTYQDDDSSVDMSTDVHASREATFFMTDSSSVAAAAVAGGTSSSSSSSSSAAAAAPIPAGYLQYWGGNDVFSFAHLPPMSAMSFDMPVQVHEP